MSNTLRIKGQDVVITLTANGSIVQAIRNIRNFSVTPKLDQKTEDYLGETSPQFDEVYSGVGVSFSMHMSDPAVFDLVNKVIRRAQRKEIGLQINVKATLNFPNGQKRKVVCNDLYFGNFPINFGSRSDYGEISVDAMGADFIVIN